MTFPITGRKIRIGLVGCGHISRNHLAAVENNANDVELVAACDPNMEAVAAVAEKTGARTFASLDEMIEGADLDMVALATPTGLHREQTERAAEAGCHVVTEKPMATTWEDGKAMVRACDEADVRLFVIKPMRFHPVMRALKYAIERGRFGDIYMVNATMFWTRPQEYYDRGGGWRGTWAMDGGALMNQASHLVDLLYWFLGPLKRVHAFSGTLARNIEAEDSIVLNFEWQRGALGAMAVTMLTWQKNLEATLTIIGEKGTVQLAGNGANEVRHWDFAEPESVDEEMRAGEFQHVSAGGFGHTLCYENMIATLRGDAEPLVDGREGLKSLEYMIAAYRSARENRPVALPLEMED